MRRLVFLLFFTLFLIPSHIQASVVNRSQFGPVRSGLVGYWTFDGKNMTSGRVNDLSGNGNTGNPINISTTTFYTAGKIGQGFHFDGVNDTVNMGSPSSLDDLETQGGGGMTVAFWIKPDSNTSASLIGKGTDSNNSGTWLVTKNSTTNPARLTFKKEGSTDMTSQRNSFLTTGVWTHVVITYDGSMLRSGVIMYKNGVVQADGGGGGDGSTANSDAASNLYIGSTNGISAFCDCSIDDVRIFNRILTQAEVTTIYNLGGHAAKTNVTRADRFTNGLVGYWTFDGKDMASGRVADVSSSGNTGNLFNISTTTFYRPGRIGQGLNFDNVDDYIQLNSPATLDDLGPMSISTWVYPRGSGESTSGIIIHKSNGFGVSGWMFAIDSASTPGALRHYFSRDYATTDLQRAAADGVIPLNKWSHLVMTWDGSSTAANVKFYLDGQEVSSYPVSTNGVDAIVADAASTVQIGNNSAGSRTFDGIIDDMRVYNRVLSATEVSQIYNLGR